MIQMLRLCDEYDGQEHYFDISEKEDALALMSDWVHTTGRLNIFLELLRPHRDPEILLWASSIWTSDLQPKQYVTCSNCNLKHVYVGDIRESCSYINTRETLTNSGRISISTAKCDFCDEYTLPIDLKVNIRISTSRDPIGSNRI